MATICRTFLLLSCVCLFSTGALQSFPHPQRGDSSTADRDWTELNSSMEKMHAAMSAVEPSGQEDVDFVRLMLPHHQAAIDMAKVQLLRGTDPQIRRLAQEIIADQQSEIELMQLWLSKHTPKHP